MLRQQSRLQTLFHENMSAWTFQNFPSFSEVVVDIKIISAKLEKQAWGFNLISLRNKPQAIFFFHPSAYPLLISIKSAGTVSITFY